MWNTYIHCLSDFLYITGTMDFVLIWSCLNFLGITCEGLARAVGRNTSYQQWEGCEYQLSVAHITLLSIPPGYLGHRAVRRLHALLASPLLVMSSLSNFYFFAGKEVSKARFVY
jgi:hypothetical protein